jgi:FkbM family methyltransferase
LLPVSRFEIGIFLERLSIGRYINTELVEKANIVDVGAYVGDSSLLFSKLTSGKVYAFEPIEAHFKLLNKTVALNKLTNVVPVKLGLGAKNYETEIVLQGAGSSLVLKKSCREVEKIEIRSLDDFISENKLQVGLIKVDIEGAERDFLKGAEKTIRAQRPILIISIYHSAEDFFTIKPMIDGWGCGYSFRIWKPLDGYILADTCLIAVSDNGNPHGGMQ